MRTRAAGWSTSRSRRLRPARSWRRWDARAPSRGRSSTRSSSEPPGCAVRTPLSSTSSRTRRSGCLGSPAMSRWSSGATRRSTPCPRAATACSDVWPRTGPPSRSRRPGRPRLRAARPAAPRRLPSPAVGADAPQRRRHRDPVGVAHRGPPLRRGRGRPHQHVRVPGGDRPAPGRARRGVGRPQQGARRQGHPARGAARDRRRGQLEPGPRGGPRRDRERRRTAHRRRRRLDHGVRPGRGQLPGAGHGRRHRSAHRSAA